MTEPRAYDPVASPRLTEPEVVGSPLARVDGRLKVTGRATYTHDFKPPGTVAYGFIVGATIARGRVLDVDVREAEQMSGVLAVLTHLNAPPQAPPGPPVVENRLARARPELADAEVRYRGDPIALVVAESFEAARDAAGAVTARYESDEAVLDLAGNLASAYAPAVVGPGLDTDTAVGDFARGFAASPVRVDARYSNAYQKQNPMEPHAALAFWTGGDLTAYVSQQSMGDARTSVAATLQIAPERVHLVSHYVGGGFGSKLPVNPEVVLAALAAEVVRRPVKVALTRQQMFANSGHRGAFEQRVRLGASRDGRLDAIAHEAWTQTGRYDEYGEQAAAPTRSLYAAADRLTRHRFVPLDLQHGESMRAPGEAPGLLALESAMDELAVALDLDPVELRIRNEPTLDPERQVPFSSRRLVECLREGAQRFGWAERNRSAGARREGRLLIGHGMSAGIRPNRIVPAFARIALRRDGSARAELDLTDIGTGSYTIMAQIGADALGVPVDRVEVALGESDFPRTSGSAGSLGAGSAGSALYNACLELRRRLAADAVADPASPLFGADADRIDLDDGALRVADRREALADVARRAPAGSLTAEGSVGPAGTAAGFSQQAYAAFFAEVSVDADTAEVFVRRMLGVFDVGRVLNARTARSQLIGGMIWGISGVLHEEAVVDPRYGQFVNQDLAGYHVAVNADVGDIEAVCLDGLDHQVNPLGSKGVGEIPLCGSGAAVANAVFNATGVRVRSFPITLDKILPGMGAAGG